MGWSPTIAMEPAGTAFCFALPQAASEGATTGARKREGMRRRVLIQISAVKTSRASRGEYSNEQLSGRGESGAAQGQLALRGAVDGRPDAGFQLAQLTRAQHERADPHAAVTVDEIVGLDLCQIELHPVSYTHLRAHETRHDLVCRLLL